MEHNGVEYEATDRKYETSDKEAVVSFDIAAAYPKEAGIKKWIRTVRSRHQGRGRDRGGI